MAGRLNPRTAPETPPVAPPPPAPLPSHGDGDTVVVACKIPNGLVLQIYDMVDFDERSPAGVHMVKKAWPKEGARIRLNGPGNPIVVRVGVPVEAGYGLTVVPRDFWERWSADNKDSDLFKNKSVFACSKQEDTAARAREQSQGGIKSGFEPIDPKKPPRVGMPVSAFNSEKPV
jgi:hypothetical protein